MRQHATIQALLISLVTLLLVGCSASVSYKPPLLPVKLVIDNAGNISVEGEVSIVTFVGEFSIGAEYTLSSKPDSILVIIRDRNKGTRGLDTIYRVRTSGDEFTVVLNGETTVQVVNKQVIIDVTNANVKTIEFRRADEDTKVAISGFWGNDENSYRPFKLMQRMIDKDTWLSRTVAMLLFPVELIAIPLFVWLRIGSLLFGDIGVYAAYFIYVVVFVISLARADESDGNKLFAVALFIITVCASIIAIVSLLQKGDLFTTLVSANL